MNSTSLLPITLLVCLLLSTCLCVHWSVYNTQFVRKTARHNTGLNGLRPPSGYRGVKLSRQSVVAQPNKPSFAPTVTAAQLEKKRLVLNLVEQYLQEKQRERELSSRLLSSFGSSVFA